MRTYYLLSLLLLFCRSAFAQSINYQPTFERTLQEAAQSHKPIFLYVPSHSLRIGGHNRGALDLPEVINLYNRSFVNYELNKSDTSLRKLVNKYGVGASHTYYLFLDTKGNLIYRRHGTLMFADKCIAMAKEVTLLVNSGKTIVDYETKYNTGNFDANFLKEYIAAREELELYNNAKLIDQYVDLLTTQSFNDYQNVLFVLKAGPYADGKAYKLAHLNKSIIDSIYKTEPIPLRRIINNRIISNTRIEAIKTKNMKMAINTSVFIRNAWGKNYKIGDKQAQASMLAYYLGVKDTANYYSEAQKFYDNFMSISADSAKILRQQRLETVKKDIENESPELDELANKYLLDRKDAVLNQLLDSRTDLNPVSQELNYGAYKFYLLGTHNSAYLLKAVSWCQRAIELNDGNYDYYNTYAHLQYRLKQYKEAEHSQSKAITLAQSANLPDRTIEYLQNELLKIKQYKL